ncbi:protogenin-like isoform X2 [Prorops nasuta]|uniref:protogenin-like isoform X2 n=1 Tax=Prorops nasuta TaxID=863751 RepID=UPI0034CFD67F
MAARVLLLSILFTDVFKSTYAAGIKGIGVGVSGRDLSKAGSLDINISRASDLVLEIQPSGHVILGRRALTLSCTGGSSNIISWSRNGSPVPPCDPSICTILRNGSLHFYKQKPQMVQKSKEKEKTKIIAAKANKQDEYRCIAQTSSGGLLRSAPTFIQIAEIAHVFNESPEDITVQEGEVTRMSCQIDSIPSLPNITWLHNGKAVVLNHNNSSKYSLVPPGVLYISATKLSDAGSYRCIATNDFLKKTKKSKEAKLTVISQLEIDKSRTSSSLYPQTSYKHWLTNGSSLNLVCAASGYPSPFITWTFIPRYADNNSTQPRIILNSTTGIVVLSLKNVTTSSAGIYICSMKNVITKSLEVQNITVEILVPPTFLKKPANQICPNGRTARFECQAQGVPEPRIYWLKDSLNITINGRRTNYVKEHNKMELAISATVPSDSGVYQCVAVNSAGEIWAAGRLQVNTSRNSPAAPTSLKCSAISPVKIFISWKPPKSLPHTSITAYTVHYSPVGGKEEVSPPEPGNSTSVEVTKLLEPFTNYSFYIRVWNNHGASDQSATIVCSTAPSVPKCAPKITVGIVSSTRLNVSWEPLSKKEARGEVVEYKLQWKLHQHPTTRVLFLPASIENYVLSDLIPGAQYDLRVLAKTKQGWPNMSDAQSGWATVTMPSPESDQITIKNFVDIDLLVLNSSVVKMKWKTNFKEPIPEVQYDSWQIYCENRDGQKLKTIVLPKNITEYSFSNLDADIAYTMGLCIVNSGEPAGCLTKQIDSNVGLGKVPISLEAIPISSTAINLTWIVNYPSAVNCFEICYYTVHVENFNRSNCVLVNDTKLMVNQLKPFTLYQFKIRAILNDTDQTDLYSEAIECYTNEDVPGKVEEVQWILWNSTRVRVAWKEPNKTNGILQHYFIAYTTDLDDLRSTWRNITVPGNKTSAVLPDLLAGKRYFVMIQAATKAGRGTPSNPMIVITGGSASKIPTSSDEQKPAQRSTPDQSLGVILGVSISIGFIMICLCSIYCRRKCESLQSLRESAQPLKRRVLLRNGNGCCEDQSSTSTSQQINVTVTPNEIELSVLCPPTPNSTNPQSDAKGGRSNGIVESCVKEPLLPSWDRNIDSKSTDITDNSQYKKVGNNSATPQQESEQNLDGTQLTIVNCTLGSDSSLNNNFVCLEEDVSPQKVSSTSVPVIGPNG